MAETPVSPNDASETGPPAPGRFLLLAKLRVLLLVVVVVALECLAAYLYLPSPSQTAAMAGATLGPTPPPAEDKQQKPPSGKPGEEKEKELADEMEVDLGEYCVTAFQSNVEHHVAHRLPPVRNRERREPEGIRQTHGREQAPLPRTGPRHRAERNVSDLTDAGLGLMKRKILERANRTLGKPLLQSVVVSDFSFVEQ